ncbi:Imidazole glycerol phosphate synthase subunit HisH [Streptomyces cyaneofuscatus]
MNADGLLVPGVGAFSACMDGLKRARGDWIVGRRLAGGRPVMGICVGTQILFERGIEHGVETEGLDEWPGTVGPLKADIVPHMGWNTVEAPEDSRLFAGLDPEARFYFVHSYAAHDWSLEVTNAKIRAPRSPGPRTANGSWPPWRTARCGPPSSTPRSPAMPAPSC